MPAGLRRGRPARRALLASLLTSTLAIAQTPPKPTAKKTTTHRANELTLAGLRPGRDRLDRAVHRYRDYHKNDPTDSAHDAQTTWLEDRKSTRLNSSHVR